MQSGGVVSLRCTKCRFASRAQAAWREVLVSISRNLNVNINKVEMDAKDFSTKNVAILACKKSKHKLWRDSVKKRKRKLIRQKLARERDTSLEREEEARKQSAGYQHWLKEQELHEQLALEEEERERERQNALWLAREASAQEQWKQSEVRREKARQDREAQERLIREEWAARQSEELKVRGAKERLVAEKKQQQENWLQQLQDFLNSSEDQTESQLFSQPPLQVAGEVCGFFAKIGTCRFGDFCSRVHNKPYVSPTLLIRGFFFYLNLRSMKDEHDTDTNLEFEDSEIYLRYLEFSGDILPEFQKYGQVVQFKVCCNTEPHLRGNVYVQYSTLRQAVHAFTVFNGRWYSGKQVTVEFVTVPSWRAAICGHFTRGRCPKGQSCNFLHVFRHPGNAFGQADRDWPLLKTATTKESTEKVPRQQEHHHSHNAQSSRSRSRSPSCSRNRERGEDHKTKRSTARRTATLPTREANEWKRSKSKERTTTTTQEWRWSESPEPGAPLFADFASPSPRSSPCRLPSEENASPKEAIRHSHRTPSSDTRKEALDKHRSHRRHCSSESKKTHKKKKRKRKSKNVTSPR